MDDSFFPLYLLVVTERLVEQGKSVVDVFGDGYRIALRCFRLAEHLDPFPGSRLRRLSGKLGPSHVHCSQRRTSTSQRNSASILLAICAERRTDSRVHYIHQRTLSAIRAHIHALTRAASCVLCSRSASYSANVGWTRSRSAAKYARTRETENLGYQGGLRCHTSDRGRSRGLR